MSGQQKCTSSMVGMRTVCELSESGLSRVDDKSSERATFTDNMGHLLVLVSHRQTAINGGEMCLRPIFLHVTVCIKQTTRDMQIGELEY